MIRELFSRSRRFTVVCRRSPMIKNLKKRVSLSKIRFFKKFLLFKKNDIINQTISPIISYLIWWHWFFLGINQWRTVARGQNSIKFVISMKKSYFWWLFFLFLAYKFFMPWHKIPHFPPLKSAYKLLICQEYKRIFAFYARNIYQGFTVLLRENWN